MNSSRFLAFYDAVLAIVMTILVLSFNIPDPDSWQNIARMIPGFVCYAASFFWLGLMWISSYMAWGKVEVVSERSLFYMLVSLFFSSFFPFATGLVGQDMNSVVAEVFYGVVVLCITVSNIALTGSINRDHSQPQVDLIYCCMTLVCHSLKENKKRRSQSGKYRPSYGFPDGSEHQKAGCRQSAEEIPDRRFPSLAGRSAISPAMVWNERNWSGVIPSVCRQSMSSTAMTVSSCISGNTASDLDSLSQAM